MRRSGDDLEACDTLLENLPADFGSAVVVASAEALDPRRVASRTRLRVVPAADGVPVAPGHLYVVPPQAIATVAGDALRLVERSATAAPDRPIDHLFRSLAVARRDRALGVLLSGAGTVGGDGTLGAREIRQIGGITLATGVGVDLLDGGPGADLVLGPAGIAGRLGELAARRPTESPPGSAADVERLTGLYCLLRAATGADLSRIRISRTLGRVRRRMALAAELDLGAYVDRLARDPVELEALHLDLYRRPTSFFRDPEVFAYLHEVFAHRLATGEPVRIWVAGCGTGEETYSLAMMLLESVSPSVHHVPVRILATDDDDRLIERARAGVYPTGIALDVSSERLRRHFVRTLEGHHQVRPALRDIVTFGRHDLVDDPPFSQLDLVWCPDGLGRLDPVAVSRVLPRFHFGLRPDGIAFLGDGETPVASGLFEPIEGVAGVYARRGTVSRWFQWPARAQRIEEPSGAGRRFDLQGETDRAVLQRYGPPGVVIDDAWDVILLRGAVAPYVSLRTDEPRPNLERLGHPDLLPEIRRLLHLARVRGSAVRGVPTRVRRAHGANLVEIDVVPLHANGVRSWLVTFEEAVGRRFDEGTLDPDAIRRDAAATLRREVEEVRRVLGDTLRQRDEDLVCAREEIASLAEECRSLTDALADEHRARIAAEAAAHDARDEVEAVLASASAALVLVDAQLRIRGATPGAEALFRVREADHGRPLGDLRHGFDLPDLEARIAAVVASGQASDREVHDRAGHRYTLAIRPFRVADRIAGASVAALPLGDAGREELAREQSARREAEAANSAKDEFLAMLAHELRNPLAPLQSSIQLLQRHDGDADRAAALAMALRQVRHIARLVDDLLDAARLTRSKVVPRLELVEGLELLARVVHLHRPTFEQADLHLSLELPPDPVWLLADPTRIEQVLANLLQNAVRYSTAGGAVAVEASEEEGDLVVRVRDHGVGIDADLLPRVFDLFVHGRRSRERPVGGLGIGLTIVKRLVELHGGSVTVHSAGPGLGSEFVVRLPMHPPPSRDLSRDDDPRLPAPHRRRVVVVDDRRDAADAFAALLRSGGHDVRTAHDGPAALAVIEADPPDVVLLDIGLPGMNGFEVAAELRRRMGERTPRMVAITGYGDERDRQRSQAVGFHDHLVKPIEPLAIESLLLDPAARCPRDPA